MSFVFPFVLGGVLLVGIPVLIHLVMRQKPKTLRFPAFRFLVQRSRTNLRKLRLRHLLLLTLRMLLIAIICLALAQPKVFYEPLKLGTDRPVAAVLVFDTSPTMEYTISGAKGTKQTRLDDAKRRGRELLDQLPGGSRVLILDSADPPPAGKGEWLTSFTQAAKRIDGLRLRPGSGPVTARIEDAYRLLSDLARSKDDEKSRSLPRLLCVFSDRTSACWDKSRMPQLHDLRDQVPILSDRLPRVRERMASVHDALQGLRDRIPAPAGQNFPDDRLLYLLDKLRDATGTPIEDGYPGAEVSNLVAGARSTTRELLVMLGKANKDLPATAKEDHTKVLGVLRTLQQDLRGAHELFFDVGDDNPRDGAILDLELPGRGGQDEPQQVFAADRTFQVRALVQATGADLNSTLQFQVGGKKEARAVEVKAGQRLGLNFEVDCKVLGPGPHQAKVELLTADAMPMNNSRYVSFAVQQPRQILVLADEPAQAKDFQWAHASFKDGAFRVVIRKPPEITPKEGVNALEPYAAVVLFNVKAPDKSLWEGVLIPYVQSGGGLAIVPGDVDVAAYNTPEAQQLMPAKLVKIVALDNEIAGRWNWDTMTFQHPMIAPFREWRDTNRDLFKNPNSVSRYWQVEIPKGVGTPLIYYIGEGKQSPPALLDRRFDTKGSGRAGRVLLFTTRLDPANPPWNDYLNTLRPTTYVALVSYSAKYLAGDLQPVRMNFLSGQTVPIVPLPLAMRLNAYSLFRNGEFVKEMTAEAAQNELRLPEVVVPGNYAVKGEDKHVGVFSVNLPQEECLLTRVPAAEVEALFGEKSVTPLDVRTDLREAIRGQWSQPQELLPYLMILVLLLLAVENLLANKFYRKQAEPTG